MTIAIYPGSFDPPTNGHLSLVEMGLNVFEKIIVSVAINPNKKTLFTLDERLELLKECLAHLPFDKIEIAAFDGLTVDFAKAKGASAILRGLRGSADFEYEYQLAVINRHLEAQVQTIFLMADYHWFFISSSTIKEAASLGANIDALVHPAVATSLKSKYKTSQI
ncbi:MAG: pantetheine-phosphate adenylyltransferase [Deltaproteobacteria bacterium]|jgi:pantetheine-phosphate adenylyltransferase|nr:pantetheine-phosphate adenylyltransferase [Deltaproteobacteria bacterium]